jgi:hypothetical protein
MSNTVTETTNNDIKTGIADNFKHGDIIVNVNGFGSPQGKQPYRLVTDQGSVVNLHTGSLYGPAHTDGVQYKKVTGPITITHEA